MRPHPVHLIRSRFIGWKLLRSFPCIWRLDHTNKGFSDGFIEGTVKSGFQPGEWYQCLQIREQLSCIMGSRLHLGSARGQKGKDEWITVIGNQFKLTVSEQELFNYGSHLTFRGLFCWCSNELVLCQQKCSSHHQINHLLERQDVQKIFTLGD